MSCRCIDTTHVEPEREIGGIVSVISFSKDTDWFVTKEKPSEEVQRQHQIHMQQQMQQQKMQQQQQMMQQMNGAELSLMDRG